MRTFTLLVVLSVVGCGHERATASPTSPRVPRPPVHAPTAEDASPSTCAFGALDDLCAGFREHHRSSGTGWVSDECAYGARRTSIGAFAEVMLVGVHVGSDAAAPGPHVERALLEGVVHTPPTTDAPTTQLMLAARIGVRWFPLWLFSGGAGTPPFSWTLDADGAFVRAMKPQGDRVEHMVFGVHGGVPRLAVSAITGAHDAAPAVRAPDTWLAVCGFTPVVRAVTHTPPTDEASRAAIARARARLEGGRFVDVTGARSAVMPNAATSVIEVYETSGSACGGGGCTTGVGTRTIEGTMPEQGVHYFRYEHGTEAGCHRDALPEVGESTLLEVAPARPDASVGCGFSGFDGTTRLTWVITRVFVSAR